MLILDIIHYSYQIAQCKLALDSFQIDIKQFSIWHEIVLNWHQMLFILALDSIQIGIKYFSNWYYIVFKLGLDNYSLDADVIIVFKLALDII